MKQKVAFKGTVNGIILQYDTTMSFGMLYDEIEKKLIEANRFFEGSHVIGVESGVFSEDEERKLSALFLKLGGMKVLSLEETERLKHNDAQKKQPKKANKKIAKSEQKDVNDDEIIEQKPDSETQNTEIHESLKRSKNMQSEFAVFHKGTLRSGRSIVSDGHIVLLGDANPGSELIAEGNVVVMGALRGFVHAGKSGNNECYIVATQLQPTQIRIGGHITRPPDEAGEGPGYTEIASIEDNQIVIAPYK